ncbi:MAG: cyclic nucleotide-binding domain-containing protein [Bryobacterales bacterium]|nr:cyclic nucleotide-binding domain-containing protein [Bryobacterales bacterium]
MSSLATTVVVEEDEIVLEEGQRSEAFYFLISGSVAVEMKSPVCTINLQVLGPGEVFGWSSLLDMQDTLFQVRSRERTTVLRLSGRSLIEAFLDDAELGAEFMRRTLKVVAGRVKATELRFAEMCGVRVRQTHLNSHIPGTGTSVPFRSADT